MKVRVTGSGADKFSTLALLEGMLSQSVMQRVTKRSICVTQCNKWKQLLPRRVFTHGAAAQRSANNGKVSIFHVATPHASRVLCGQGLSCWS